MVPGHDSTLSAARTVAPTAFAAGRSASEWSCTSASAAILAVVIVKAWLDGHPYDLEELAELLPTGDTRVVKEGDDYYLASLRIDNRPEDVPFYAVASSVLQQVNGLARAMRDGFRPVRLTGRYTEGDQRHVVVSADVAEGRSRAYAPAIVTGRPGEPPRKAPPVGPMLLTVAGSNYDVAEVLDIMGRVEAPNWSDLYKVYEIIEHTGTLSSAMNAAAVSENRMSLFRRTANHEKASGPDARHSRSKQDPPKNPMTIEEARRLISALIQTWVESLQP